MYTRAHHKRVPYGRAKFDFGVARSKRGFQTDAETRKVIGKVNKMLLFFNNAKKAKQRSTHFTFYYLCILRSQHTPVDFHVETINVLYFTGRWSYISNCALYFDVYFSTVKMY